MRSWQGLLVGFVFLPGFALAEEETSPAVSQLARQTLAVIDVIATQHIEAPPKQELVRQIVSGIRRQAGLGPALGLGPQLSRLTGDEEFLEVLEDQWQQVLQAIAAIERQFGNGDESTADSQSSGAAILVRALTSLLHQAPGQNRLTDTREQRVQDQLAANRYVGIGITLGGASDRELPRMLTVFPNGPAAKAGAQDRDQILEIDGVATDGVPLGEIVQRLRGPADTQVELLLKQDDGEPRRYTMTRGVVPIQRTHVKEYKRKGKSIMVIRFDQITSATVHDLRKIASEWDTPPDAVLLDLTLVEHDLHRATLLADALLDGGTIGRVLTADGEREVEASRGCVFGEIPLFALVGSSTSGGIEWVAAALQDQQQAIILGQQTAGQPFVSEPTDVPGTDWVLTLSTGILERADGRSLLRTSPVGARVPIRVVPRDENAAAGRGSGLGRVHDGGVVPTKPFEGKIGRIDPAALVRQFAPAAADFIRDPSGPASIEQALEVVFQLITDDSTAEAS